MQALLLREYGDPPVLTVGDIAEPAPAAGQVLIRVHAAGFNPIDNKLARGWMAAVMKFELPVALGWDAAGVVAAAGDGVERFGVGDEVLASLGPPTGTMAEFVLADADGPWIAPKPKELSMVDAAAIPMVGLTAMTALRMVTVEGPVLVIGATGGIGAFLVPLLAERSGTDIIATTSPGSAARLRAAGAAHTIDYRSEDVAAAVAAIAPDGPAGAIDFINQFGALEQSAALLRPGGQLLSTVFGPDPSEFARQDITVSYVRNDPENGDLERVAELVASGRVQPVAVQAFPLAEAPLALERLHRGEAGGKLVATVSER